MYCIELTCAYFDCLLHTARAAYFDLAGELWRSLPVSSRHLYYLDEGLPV